MTTQNGILRAFTTNTNVVQDPPIARLLFSDTRFSPVWLVVRIIVGWPWMQAGIEKVFSVKADLVTPSGGDWMGAGLGLKAFWEHVLGIGGGNPLPAYNWYESIINFLYQSGAWTWFSKLVALGELTVGICIIIGAFTGIAAFFGSFMNWNFGMAGVASINIFLFSLAVLLVLAWKTAGYWGVDRFLLPRLGTPWGRTTTAGSPGTPQSAPPSSTSPRTA
jgi:thiosulfate dehydrogenase [quinone] large subunit